MQFYSEGIKYKIISFFTKKYWDEILREKTLCGKLHNNKNNRSENCAECTTIKNEYRKEKKQITIFICEDDEIGREIIGKYLTNGKITYAEFVPEENRKKIVDFLKDIENHY